MTDIDTAALRAEWGDSACGNECAVTECPYKAVMTLCDALDAAQKAIARYEVSQKQMAFMLDAKHQEMRAAQARADRYRLAWRSAWDRAKSGWTYGQRQFERAEAAQARADDLAAEVEYLREDVTNLRALHREASQGHARETVRARELEITRDVAIHNGTAAQLRAEAAEARAEKAENQARYWRVRAEKNDEISQIQKARAERAEAEVEALRELESLQRLSLHRAEARATAAEAERDALAEKCARAFEVAISDAEAMFVQAGFQPTGMQYLAALSERDAARAQVAAVRALCDKDAGDLTVDVADVLAALAGTPEPAAADSTVVSTDPKNFLADLEPPKCDQVERRPIRRTPWAQVRRKSASAAAETTPEADRTGKEKP